MINNWINEIHLQTVDSTNTWAKKHLLEFDQTKITYITTDEQTAGRGRYNSKWISPPNENIYATFCFCLPSKKFHFHNLPELLCLTCIKVLLQFDIDPKIKWPNDIVVNDKKIAGVLCEVINEKDKTIIALGIGLNVNAPKEGLSNLGQPATSLHAETSLYYNRNQILACIKNIFASDLLQYFEKGFSPFRRIYESFLREIGKPVMFEENGQPQEAICHSISNEGLLNLQLSTGEIITSSCDTIRLLSPAEVL